jgi:hypothetical protein
MVRNVGKIKLKFYLFLNKRGPWEKPKAFF